MNRSGLLTAIELGSLAAALVLQREKNAEESLLRLRARGCSREAVREAILQTYLFDGYPTALEGMAQLSEIWPGDPDPAEPGDFSQWSEWEARGWSLYNRVYGRVAERLQDRARELSPELARWMIVEGYGKVLSRGGLDITTRELVIVSVLAVKNRQQQLHSHVRGALRLGAARAELRALLNELHRRYDPPGWETTLNLLDRIRG